jgi:NodT family efflux transporter outer membrane factor (OMF) lipoprotein
MNPRRKTSLSRQLICASLACALVGGCMVGPNYRRPPVTTPPDFKEAKGWVPAQPSDAADKSDWWTVFGDPMLNDLETRVNVSNQTIAADEAAYREAHAMVAEARAALFPTVTGSAGVTGSHNGASAGGKTTTSFQPSLGATWAPDLWGAVRRQINSAKATAQASAATLANARLSLQTELATDYINLRELDQEKRIYDEEIAADQHALDVIGNQYNAGTQAQSAVLTEQTLLQSAQAADVDLERQRALMEHAIAILVGVAPAELTLAPAPWNLKLPQIPTVVPSTVLQRRPDIATAERQAASANELIGVQVAAYYPTLSLTGDVGFDATTLGQLFNAANFFWTLGATASETIFDAGLRHARVAAARAAYDESVATYRQTVLTAFQNVEDNLAAQRVYGGELTLLTSAAQAAVRNQAITFNEYNAGTVDYTTVASSQVTALQAQLSQLQVEASRLGTAVALIEALGGGWTASDLPKS